MPDFSRLSRRTRLILAVIGSVTAILSLMGSGANLFELPEIVGPAGRLVSTAFICLGLLGILVAAHNARGLGRIGGPRQAGQGPGRAGGPWLPAR